MKTRPLTVGELRDYLAQFPDDAAVFNLGADPQSEVEMNRHEDEGMPYILLDCINFTVEVPE